MRRTSVLLVVPALVLASIGATAPTASADVAEFIVKCPVSHRAADDPIVYPGKPGAAHRHDFFGNRSTDASSTFRSLRGARTSCGLPADKAAYWVPTLYARGRATKPDVVRVYYTTRLRRPSAIRPFPKGLKMIAGNSHAHGPQSLGVVHWDCGQGGSSRNRPHPVDCGAGFVQASIIFPECWNGIRRDSRNHKRHMAYAVDDDDDGRYRCPRSHPRELPRIKVVLQWPVHDGTHVHLSSGHPHTLHGDFFDAWTRRPLVRLIQRCLVQQRTCGRVGS